MEIGKKIKGLRIQRGLTQEELASRCELSKGFISLVERDLTSPSIATLMDMLESLGTDMKTFFGEATDEKVVFGEKDIFVKELIEFNYREIYIILQSIRKKCCINKNIVK